MRALVTSSLSGLLAAAAPLAPAPGAVAAEPAALETAPSEAARAYLEAIRGRGIEAGVRYYPHDGPAPVFETDAALPEPPPAQAEDDGPALPREVVLAAVLAGVLYLAIRGGASPVSLRRNPDPGRRPRGAHPPEAQASAPVATDLERLAADPDRERALVALAREALARAAAVQGLRLGRSWTARDTLRRIPASWPHRGALARLVHAAELTHFGGRPVAESAFRRYLDEARPIFADGQRSAG